MSDEKKVIKGQFREPVPDSSASLSLDLLQEVEQRDDGPWLVVYAFGKKMGEVPIKPGTEPDIKLAKAIDINRQSRTDE